MLSCKDEGRTSRLRRGLRLRPPWQKARKAKGLWFPGANWKRKKFFYCNPFRSFSLLASAALSPTPACVNAYECSQSTSKQSDLNDPRSLGAQFLTSSISLSCQLPWFHMFVHFLWCEVRETRNWHPKNSSFSTPLLSTVICLARLSKCL